MSAYDNAWRAKRRAKGMCLRCHAPSAPGYVLCAAHLDRKREYERLHPRDLGVDRVPTFADFERISDSD